MVVLLSQSMKLIIDYTIEFYIYESLIRNFLSFKSFYRYIVPMIQKHALSVLIKGATIVGTEAIDSCKYCY